MKILKKHKYKLLTLMLSIISIFTLFLGINKTYAYQTLDNFSESINIDTTTYGDNVSSITYNSTDKYYDITCTINSSYTNAYIYFDFKNNDLDIYNNWSYYALLSNIAIYNNTNTILSTSIQGTIIYGNYGVYTGSTLPYRYVSQFLIDNKYFSCVFVPNILSNSWYKTNNSRYYFGFQFNSTGTYHIRLYNIDIVDKATLSTSYIYDTYYGQLEENYNQLLSDYNDLQDNYDTLEDDYSDLLNNYAILNDNYNELNEEYNTLENNYNELNEDYEEKQQQIEQIESQYNNIINQVAPFNPNNIQSTTVLFNNTSIAIPYNSFVIFDYFQIELDLMDFDLLNSNDYRHLIQSRGNELTITLNLEKPIMIDKLEYWSHMRDFYDDYLDLTLMNNSEIVAEYTLMNNEHQDQQGNMAPYYISSGTQQINRLIFNFNLNDSFYNNYQGYIDYMLQKGTYTQGYNDGLNASNEYIESLKQRKDNEISILSEKIEWLQDDILTQKQTIQALNEQIASINHDYNLNSLMWTIASTPFESFKQIWNVNFLGVNISQMVTGIITAFIAIYIVKKFFL